MFPLAPQKQRLQSIDFLRGVASVGVVLLHAGTYQEVEPQEKILQFLYHVFELGWIGVPLFFVISGFCIHLRWAKGAQKHGDEKTHKIDFFSFWKRRFWRLYPPYFVALCFSMLLLLTAFLTGVNVALLNLYPEPKLAWMGYDFFFHVTMLHGFHPLFDRNGGNPVFWSLAREEYLYLLYFVFLFFRKRIGCINTNIGIIILSIVSLLVANYFVAMSSPWWIIISTSAIALWFQWTLGTISAESYLNMLTLPKFASSPVMIVLWGAIACYFTYSIPELLIQNYFWGLCFFTLVNFCIKKEQDSKASNAGYLNKPIGRFFADIGIWSYSLYLIHNPVQKVIKNLLGSLIITDSIGIYLLAVMILATAGYIAGKIFFLTIEKRFIT